MTDLQRTKQQRAEAQLETELWVVIDNHKLTPIAIASVLMEMALHITTRMTYKKKK